MSIIIQINDLIDAHETSGEPFTKCEGCSTCDQIKQLREELEGKKVMYDKATRAKLAKGENMTTGDIEFLVQNKVSRKDIQKALNVSSATFNRLLKSLNLTKPKKNKGEENIVSSKLDITIEEYVAMKRKKWSDTKIAAEKGLTPQQIYSWKFTHKKKIQEAMDGIVVEKKTPNDSDEKYNKLKTEHENALEQVEYWKSLYKELEEKHKFISEQHQNLKNENEQLHEKLKEKTTTIEKYHEHFAAANEENNLLKRLIKLWA